MQAEALTSARHPTFEREEMPVVRRRLVVAVFVLIIGVGCLLAFLAMGGSALEGTSWRLMAWSEPGIDPAAYTITASFADGQIGGTAAVNSYSGECAVGGIKFSPGAIARTEMAGPPDAMEAESIYFELLAQAETYEVQGDRLAIKGPGGDTLLEFARTE
jgi:heat shock protein HslJ